MDDGCRGEARLLDVQQMRCGWLLLQWRWTVCTGGEPTETNQQQPDRAVAQRVVDERAAVLDRWKGDVAFRDRAIRSGRNREGGRHVPGHRTVLL